MPIPFGVIAVYGALVVWTGLLLAGLKRGGFGPFLVFGIALLVVLNARYAIERAPDSIAFFIGIYDVPDNFGAADPSSTAALATCPNNQCTVWGDLYQYHPSWGVAFYERFLHGGGLRMNLLYGHIFFNSLAFVLMMVQLFRPGNGGHPQQHRVIGYVSLVSLTIGVGCACLLAAEHGSVNRLRRISFGIWLLVHERLRLRLCDHGYRQYSSARFRLASKMDVPLRRIHVGGVLAVSGLAVCAGAIAPKLQHRLAPNLHLVLGAVGHSDRRVHPKADRAQRGICLAGCLGRRNRALKIIALDANRTWRGRSDDARSSE